MNKEAFTKIETLSKIIFNNLGNASFKRPNISIPDTKGIRGMLEQVGIEYDTMDNQLDVDIKELGVTTFYHQKDLCDFVESSNTETDFAILVVTGDFNDFQYYDSQKNRVLKSGKRLADNHFLTENTVYYYKFLEKLKSNIADYKDKTWKKIIIFDKEGARILKYPNKPPLWKASGHIREVCELFFEKLKHADFQEFFKNVLADFIKPKAEENMMKTIIDNLDMLISNTDKDIRLYKSKFSYEKLKNEIREQKIKYLKNLRDILGKFVAQVVAVPLSISGTLFATYQIKNDIMLGFALSAFLIYSIYVMHVQLLYLREVWDIEEDIKDDFAKIKNDSGLGKNEFYKEEKKLIDKLSTAKTTIRFFVITIIGLTLIFLISVAALNLIKLLVVSIPAFSYVLLISARIYIHFRQVNYSDENKDKEGHAADRRTER